MIDENMSGTYTDRFFALSCGDVLVSWAVSETGPAGDDTDEFDSIKEEFDDCVPCSESVALSNGSISIEANRAKYTERFRIGVLVWWLQLEAKRNYKSQT